MSISTLLFFTFSESEFFIVATIANCNEIRTNQEDESIVQKWEVATTCNIQVSKDAILQTCNL